ncbi:MAG: hypothetical protein J6B29_06600 [Clostridia bacterium]|nr:hypothetical protein [Clostridia bacterium]
MNNKYKNKLFSILGDSISTLEKYSVPDDAVYYEGYNKLRTNVFAPSDTWWGQVIDTLGGELLVNNSFAGSMVSKHPNCEITSYGCSDKRTSDLGKYGFTPDIIMVFLGVNDWGYGVKPTLEDDMEEDISIFSCAYSQMLEKLCKNYPNAEIWCLTLPVTTCNSEEGFTFPYVYSKYHIEEYCKIIHACAKKQGCRVIDLYNSHQMPDTVEGFHPNKDGMKALAEAVLNQLK